MVPTRNVRLGLCPMAVDEASWCPITRDPWQDLQSCPVTFGHPAVTTHTFVS